MPDSKLLLLREFQEAIQVLLGERFISMILYGSYARGDFRVDSDMDIMILADVKPEEVSHYADGIYDIAYDFEVKYGIEINPNVQSNEIYEHWKNVYPFFLNIEKEGVTI